MSIFFLFLTFRGNGFGFSLFSMMLAIGSSYIAFIVLISIPGFVSAFTRDNDEYCQKLFMHLLRLSCDFCPLFCLCALLCLWV
jgi:hypothetical protein